MNAKPKLNFRCTRTKVSENLKARPTIPFNVYRKYRPEYHRAKTLLNACADVYDAKPEPSYWDCTPEEIADWILEGTGHPEYREAFIKNEIDGKGIIFLEADKFPRISIKQFDVIKASHFLNQNLSKVAREAQDYTCAMRLAGVVGIAFLLFKNSYFYISD